MAATKTASILLVNDEPVQRFRIASLLRKEGYKVKEAENGVEAIRSINAGFVPSLVITDLYMPEMDGWQLCRYLLEKNLQVPVLIISSYLEFSEIEEVLRTLGVGGYLRYPCPPEELLAKIREILQGQSLHLDDKKSFRMFLLSPEGEDFSFLLKAFKKAGFLLEHFSSLKEAVEAIKDGNFSIGLISSSFSPEELLLVKQADPNLSLFVLQAEDLEEDPFSYVLRGAKSVLPASRGAEYYLFVVERELKERALLLGQELLHQKTRELEEVSKRLVRIQSILQLVIEQATDQGLVVTDENFEPLFANPRAEKFFELAPERNFSSLLTLVVGNFDRERIKEIVQKEDVFHCEAKIGKEDRIISLKVRAFSGEGEENINGYVFFFQDLTKEREFQNRLVQMQRMEAIATLSAGIAHDFNNILAAIRLKGELLLAKLDENHVPTVRDILALCDRAAQVVRQLIDTARPSPISEGGTCELNQQVREALTFLRETIPRGINLRLELSDSSLYVPLGRGQLLQIILNLSLNAIQAMGENGSLSLRTFWKEFQGESIKGFVPGRKKFLKGSYACLVVEDTGPGIPTDLLPRIFEPYFTTKGKSAGQDITWRTMGSAGSGLGLSVTLRLIEGAGGTIAVETTPGVGTSFFVYLPLLTNLEVSDLHQMLKSFSQIKVGEGTVLIVEDEREIGQSLVSYLKERGFEVHYCLSGEEALSKLESGLKPDFLLVDLNLPGIPGRELVRRFRQKDLDSKVLVITGYLSEEDKRFLEKWGVKKILSKPFTLEELRDTLASMISEN